MIGFFNGQTEYNFLENSISLKNYVEYAKNYGYSFLTIADKNMHGYFKFYNLCIKNNIKPIIGLKILTSHSYISIYSKNDNGLQNLFKISKYQEEHKIVSFEELLKYKENIFLIVDLKQKDLFIEFDCYIGVLKNEDLISEKSLPISNIAYLNKDDFDVYQTLKKIGNSKEENVNHFKNIEELEEDFKNNNSIFKNNKIINEVNYHNVNKLISLPIYDENINAYQYLNQLASKGLQKRLEKNNIKHLFDKYNERLMFELKIINDMKYNDYFLIVWDLIKYAKKNDILVGPGRGSAAGSLVSYCLGITEIDPIKYDLYFERFLNPHRITMPDIDIDFPDNKREEVIQYVKNKYSDNNVCYISAFSTYGIKSSIKDICRVNNINVEYANLISKYLEEESLESALDKYSENKTILEVLIIASKINGLVRHVSTHAAGIILTSVQLDSHIPLKQGINGVYQSQLESSDLERKGFLKIDFLGIKNLSLINIMSKEANIQLSSIPLNDKKTFELLQKGDTNGIFQLESNGIKSVLKKLLPTNFNDIVSVLALYRPGPMDNIDLFIKRKNDGCVNYVSKKLENILKETHGIIVYQEQIMEIAVICGYTLAEADILRRAVSKKDKNILDDNRIIFVEKAKENGFNDEVSNEIYNLIVKFANYGFNKSHSVAYSRLTYEMAYIKANYPVVFISTMINNILGDMNELSNYISYAKDKKISIITPKINHSTTKCLILNNRILLPFQAISKFGLSNAKSILLEREKGKFNNFDDFKKRCSFLNELNMESLVYSCALDEFKITKKTMMKKEDIFSKYLKDEIDLDEFEYSYLMNKEKEILGVNINYDIFKQYEKEISKYKVINNSEVIKDKSKFSVIAYVEKVFDVNTKNNETMSFVDLNLNFIKINGVVFPSVFSEFSKLDFKKLALLNVVVQKRNEELQLIINNCKNI